MCTGNKIRTISHVKCILLKCVEIRKNSAEWSVDREEDTYYITGEIRIINMCENKQKSVYSFIHLLC